jgi:tetratricopeptide (TPR) repeat protein
VPAFVFFAIGLASPLNIGIRHILPVYPFFIIAAAAGICFWARKYRIVRYASIGLLVLHAATAYLAAPNYLAFSNVFFGGVDGTHRILADSNVEWGQSVKLAREYVARENVADCWFAGDDNVEINRRQQPCRMLPGSAGNWSVTEQLIEPPPVVIEGTILLSVWALPPMSVAVLPRGDEYSPVTRSEPVALIGGSILVYRGRFELPLVAALSHTGRARQLIGMNRFEEAVTEASKAVDLEPGDPNSRVVAGVALARCGRRDEARREFETAIRLAAADPSLFPWAEQNARSELQRMQ